MENLVLLHNWLKTFAKDFCKFAHRFSFLRKFRLEVFGFGGENDCKTLEGSQLNLCLTKINNANQVAS